MMKGIAMPNESLKRERPKKKEEIILETSQRLATAYPRSHCALRFSTPFQHLVATILSAQSTDVAVNKVTEKLFPRYPDPYSLAEAPLDEIRRMIRSLGLWKTKACSLKGMSLELIRKHQGEVPRNLKDLLKLPGVGEKTAKAVLGTAFGIPAGVVVDTHLFRIHRLLGVTRARTPEKLAKELEKVLPQKEWIIYSFRMIDHGRLVCVARRPRCGVCVLNDLCKSAFSKRAGYRKENDHRLPHSARWVSWELNPQLEEIRAT